MGRMSEQKKYRDLTYQERCRPKRPSTRDLLTLKKLRPFFRMHADLQCHLRNAYIATVTGLSTAHATLYMNRLVWMGMIQVLEAQQQGSKRPGLYKLTAKGDNMDLEYLA